MWMWIAAMALLGAAEPALPAWMAGCWEQESETRWTEECWTIPRGGMMMGSSRSGSGDVTAEWETMQIVLREPSGHATIRMAFKASPGGKAPTIFGWRPSKEPGVTFFNVAHDYPQRIRYWRDGRYLMAEISLADGTKPRRWRYSPLG